MAQSNSVIVTLSARDEASRVISGLQSSIEGATLKAGLLTQAISSGLSGAFSNLGQSLRTVIDSEKDLINAAATYSAITGRTYSDSVKVLELANKQIDKLSEKFPYLSGQAKDLSKSITDNVAKAFIDLNGTFNEKGFVDGLAKISTAGSFLSDLSGGDTKAATLFINKALTEGKSDAELATLAFGEENTGVLALFDKYSKELGVEFSKANASQRFQIVAKTFDALGSPEVMAANAKTLGTRLKAINNYLFSPTGIFGLSKDLEETTEGTQSVYTALNDGLGAIVGEDGLLPTLGKTMSLLGITFGDPLVFLRNGILFFTDKVKQLNTILTDFNKDKDVETLKTKVSGFFADLLPKDLGSSAQSVGEGLAKLVNRAFEFLKGLDYGFIAGELLGYIGDFFQGLGSFIATLDSGVYATLAAGILVQAWLIPGITGLAAKMLTVFAASTAGLPVILAVAAGLALGSLAKAIIDNWDSIVDSVKGFFSNVTSVITNAFNLVVAVFTGDGDKIEQSAKELTDSVSKLITEPLDIIKAALGLKDFDAEVQDNNEAGNQKLIKQIQQSNLSNKAKAEQIRLLGGTPNGATGYNNSSIMQAVAREQRQSPSGSGIVIANTSEPILNQQQQSQLVSALGNKGSLNIGNITIVTQATNAKEIAQDVMKCITDEFTKFSQGYINAPVI